MKNRNLTDLLVTLVSLALLAAAVPALAQEVPDWVLNAPGAKEYPGDDGLLLRNHTAVTIDGSGKVTRRVETAIKVLGPYIGRTGLLDPRIDWNQDRADLVVDQARSYMADGTVVDALDNSFVPNTARPLAWATAYAHLRQMTVAQVGVEEGGTTVLAYTVKDREPGGVPAWGMVELGSFMPVLDARAVFEIPEGAPFHYGGVSCDVEPEVATTNGITRYTFRMRNVPPVNTSEGGHGMAGTCRLLYSAAADWTETAAFLQGIVDGSVMDDPALTAKAKEIAGESFQRDEKLERIHRFVVDGIRTIRWPLENFDYQARPAADVLRSSVGHSLEKAALLAAMLQAVDVDACVALASGHRGAWPDVPSPVPLDLAWVRIGPGPHYTWLDPTAGQDRHNGNDLTGHTVLYLDGSGRAPVVLDDGPAPHRAALRVKVKLGDGGHELGVSGSADVDLSGRYNRFVAFDRTKDRVRGMASGIAGSFGGADAGEVHIGRLDPFESSFAARFEDGAMEVPDHGRIVLHLPAVPGVMDAGDLEAYRTARTLPLEVPGPAVEQGSVTVVIPGGYEAEYVPGEVDLDNEVGSFRRTVKDEDGKVTVTTEFVLKTPVVTPGQYPLLRALMAARDGEANGTVVIRKSD